MRASYIDLIVHETEDVPKIARSAGEVVERFQLSKTFLP